MKNNTNYSRLDEMQEVLLSSRKEILPSKYWTILNERNGL